jgi:dihydroorotase-like cyclic amidohydrolase
MEYDLVIKNGTVITSKSTMIQADIAISGEKIARFGTGLSGKQEIDASGKYIIPGAVDSHVHMQMPLPNGVRSADTFFTGTRAAAFGGTTAMVDFVAPEPDETMMEALAKRRAEADAQVAIDYGLHMTMSPHELQKLDELPQIIEAGVSTLKLYMAYGFRLQDDELFKALQAAKQYGKQEQQDSLWQALAAGALQIVTTDHCPFVKADKVRGLDNFSQIPGGVPSIEMRLAGVFAGVRKGILSLNQWVDVCCTAPAKLAGFRKKGHIAPDYDADIVIFDPEKEMTISTDTLHENVDWTLYDGLQLKGWPIVTIARGQIIVSDGEFVGDNGYGRYVERDLLVGKA